MDFTNSRILNIAGFLIFWICAAIDLIGFKQVKNELCLILGIVAASSLAISSLGFAFYRKSLVETITLYLPLNIVIFELLLYAIPYDRKWFFLYATKFIQDLQLGSIVTNFSLFVTCLTIISVRAIFIIRETIAKD
jgi:hypothetical protein